MVKYVVPLTTWANCAVHVETDSTDPEDIVRLAQEQAEVSLCHQCSGRGNDSLNLGDEWDNPTEDGKPTYTKLED